MVEEQDDSSSPTRKQNQVVVRRQKHVADLVMKEHCEDADRTHSRHILIFDIPMPPGHASRPEDEDLMAQLVDISNLGHRLGVTQTVLSININKGE